MKSLIRHSSYIILIFLGIFIQSCISNKKTTVNAPSPKEFYLKNVLGPQISNINLFTTFKKNELLAKSNSLIPELLYEDNNIEDDNYTLKVLRSGNLKFDISENEIKASLPVKIKAKARINLGFFKHEQEAEFEIIPSFKSRFSIEKNWQMKTQTIPDGFEWISKPKVKIGPVEIDVAPFIEKTLSKQLQKFCTILDEKVVELVDLKPFAEKAWSTVQQPIMLSEKHNIWVQVKPLDIKLLPIYSDTLGIKAGVNISAIIVTQIGDKPSIETNPLPEITTVEDIQNSITLYLQSKISFKSVSEIATEYLQKEEITFESILYNVKVKKVEFYGSGKRLVIKAGFEGSFDGNIYFYGIPYYDSTNCSIKVKDLNFDIETQNLILKKYQWLAKGTLLKKFEKALSFPVKNQIEQAKSTIKTFVDNRQINNYVKVMGEVEQIFPQSIDLIDDYFLINICTKGKLNMLISGY
jgi:hypothetical protein